MKKLSLHILILLSVFLSSNFANQQSDSNSQKANVSSANQYANIAYGINSLLSQKDMAKSNYSLAVYSLDKNQFIYQKNPEELLTPASTTKLFHVFSAFHLFGENGTFSTDAYADGEIKDGVLYGDIYLVGCGDPFLSGANLEELAAKTLNNSGITRITGSVYADDSFFDPMTDRKVYSGDKDVVQSMPPVSGLTFEGNAVKILANASGAPGSAVRLQSIPRSGAIKFSNTARVGGGARKVAPEPAPKSSAKAVQKAAPNKKVIPAPISKSKKTAPAPAKKGKAPIAKSSAKAQPKNAKAAVKTKGKAAPAKTSAKSKKPAPAGKTKKRADLYDFYPSGYEPLEQKYGSAKKGKKAPAVAQKVVSRGGVSIAPQYLSTGEIGVAVSGSLSPNSSQSKSFIMPKPAMIAAGFFKSALEDGGVKIEGGFGMKKLDKSKQVKLLASFKRPLKEVLYPIAKNSDNFVAEHLAKAVGGYLGNNQNSAQCAGLYAATLADSLAGKKLNVIIHDGSGLSRRNRACASAEINLLIAASKSPFYSSLVDVLSIAGVDGTLKNRMKGTAAAGNVHAKTGTHGNVSALSGYVKTKSGETLAFSFIFNGGCVGLYKQIENAICELLANS